AARPGCALRANWRQTAEGFTQLDGGRDGSAAGRRDASCHLQALPRHLVDRSVAGPAAANWSAALLGDGPRNASALAANAAAAPDAASPAARPVPRGISADGEGQRRGGPGRVPGANAVAAGQRPERGAAPCAGAGGAAGPRAASPAAVAPG